MKKKRQVLLIHGFLENQSMWNSFVAGLGKEFEVLAPNLSGCIPSTEPLISIREEASSLAQSVPENCFVIGHSMGGYVALEFAKQFPNKVSGLCLLHSTAAEDSPTKKQDRLRAIDAARSNKTLYIRTAIASLFSEESKGKLSAKLEEMINDAIQLPVDSIVACIEAMRKRVEHVSFLRQRAFPLYYFLGEKDSRIPIQEMKNELKELPGSMFQIEQGIGHMGHLECPARCFDFIQRILRADC
ncbi:MAG: alpha/beta hydrolase [Flavobacteriales bacterium]|nr:alpha/beta hydrolase [Flavobacteriales bacterium]